MQMLGDRLWLLVIAATLLGGGGCATETGGWTRGVSARLTAAERAARATLIRDTAAAAGLTNGALLAGIAMAETGMAHCHAEATWACEGPYSPSCDGPVIAGAGDGACALEQGGLGMFQFDAGTYADTLTREGDRILTVEGNVAAALDFVTSMVMRSAYIDGVDTPEQALAWMNAVEIEVGGQGFEAWVQTVTHYYNGCTPTGCSVYDERYAGYAAELLAIHAELGPDFWSAATAPQCTPLPAAGGVIDVGDPCLELGGAPEYWRHVAAGYDATLVWTNATASPAPENYAVWHVSVASAAEYLLEVYVDASVAESRAAQYVVGREAAATMVPIDQAAASGWRELGWFALVPGAELPVRLDDNTGEDAALELALVVDALRVTPRGTPSSGGAGGDGAIASEGGRAGDDAAQGANPGADPRRGSVEERSGCTCLSAGSTSRGSPGAWVVSGALTLAVFFRRRDRTLDRRSGRARTGEQVGWRGRVGCGGARRLVIAPASSSPRLPGGARPGEARRVRLDP